MDITPSDRARIREAESELRPVVNELRDRYAIILREVGGDDDAAFAALVVFVNELTMRAELNTRTLVGLVAFMARRLSNKRSDLVTFSAN